MVSMLVSVNIFTAFLGYQIRFRMNKMSAGHERRNFDWRSATGNRLFAGVPTTDIEEGACLPVANGPTADTPISAAVTNAAIRQYWFISRWWPNGVYRTQ